MRSGSSLKSVSIAIVLLALLTLTACAASKIEVSWEYDPRADLSEVRTYAWIPGPQERTGDPRVDDPLIDRRVRTAVDRALIERGFSQVDATRADFWIGYHGRVEDATTTSTMRSYAGTMRRLEGVGRERGWNVGGPAITYSRLYAIGSLNLFVVHPGTGEPLWHAIAVAEIKAKDDRETREKRILEAARRMLAKFPPPDDADASQAKQR